MWPKPHTTHPRPWDRVRIDAVPVIRAAMDASEAASVRVTWAHVWRDKLGQTSLRPAWRTSMARDVFTKVVWENLTPDEQAALLAWEEERQDGFVRWPLDSALVDPGDAYVEK
jgi:hypothetical protein